MILSKLMEIHIKQNVSQEEYNMYVHVYNLNIVNIPQPISYDADHRVMTTQLINELNISDLYGEYAHLVPDAIWQEIVNTIQTLMENNIQYPDITGYNFIWYRERIWIIDFEHAEDTAKSTNFITKFCQWEEGDPKEWNPDFR